MTEPEQERPTGDERRPWPRHWRGIAVAAGVTALGIAAIVALREPPADVPRYAVVDGDGSPTPTPIDSLRAELTRCRTLPAHVDDARCRLAWEVNRRRFHGENRSLPPMPATDPAASSTREVGER